MRVLLAAVFALLLAAAPAEDATVPAPPATVVVWNREIVTFRAAISYALPETRAAAVTARILALPISGPWAIEIQTGTIAEQEGALVAVDGQLVFGLLAGDVAVETGDTPGQAAERAVASLRAFLEAREQQYSASAVATGTAKSAGATLAYLVTFYLLVRARRRLRTMIESRKTAAGGRIRLGDVDLAPLILRGEHAGVGLLAYGLIGLASYFWLRFVFDAFPYTRPWGARLASFLIEAVERVGLGLTSAIPGLFMVALIFAVAAMANRILGAFLLGAEAGELESAWLRKDTARATRRIAALVIWAFALVAAYPHIPGSDSEAFQGVSVLIGLMVSIGSAGLANQLVSGLVVVYTQAFQTGDCVRIGDSEGVVESVGLITTRIRTARREVVVLPNSLFVSSPVWNFSSLTNGKSTAASTSVTIGYDAPWRQVHAMLLEAARRTSGIARDPEPFVLQKALSDFYVEYFLVIQIEANQVRAQVLSHLHGAIQDVFNTEGVQIMSPHFEGQPEGKVFVPRERWQVERIPPAPAPERDASAL